MKMVFILLLGLLLATGAAVAVKGSLSKKNQPVIATTKVLVATRDIAPGTFIKTMEHIAFVDMPTDQVKEEYLVDPKNKAIELEGAVVREMISAGEPVLLSKVVKPGEGGFLAAVLKPGMRAVSLAVTVVSGAAGFIFPGDKVDLMLTHAVKGPSGGERHISETFMEGIRVLAIDQQVNNPDKKAQIASTVTLEVTQKQAETLLVASEIGRISLSLRSREKEGDVAGSTSSGVPPAIPAKPPELPEYTQDSDVSRALGNSSDTGNFTVNVTRGSSSTQITGKTDEKEKTDEKSEKK